MKVSVALPSSPSSTVGESMESDDAASSSVIVPVPVPVPMVAFSAPESDTTTVSSDSSSLSSVRETTMVFVVSFAAKTSFPAAKAV